LISWSSRGDLFTQLFRIIIFLFWLVIVLEASISDEHLLKVGSCDIKVLKAVDFIRAA